MRLVIVDTFGFLFRSFYALPPLKNSKGFPTGLLTGFMNMIYNIQKEHDTNYLVFALDSKGDSFRNEIYPQYKKNRSEPPLDLLKQLPIAIEFIEEMGFFTAKKEKFEADDIIASISSEATKRGFEVKIISHDKDLYQLIDDKNRVILYDPIKKEEINEEYCLKKYQIKPKDFTTYQALVGDSIDNIPGVKGIGKKSAQELVSKYHTLDNIYNNLKELKPRWQKLLIEGKELAYISKELVTLKKDIFKIEDFSIASLPKDPFSNIKDRLEEFELNRFLSKIKKDKKDEKLKLEPILIDNKDELFEVINSIKEDSIVAFDTETDSLDTKKAKIVGFSFCFEEDRAYYVPINHFYLGVGKQIDFNDAKEAILRLNKFKLVAQNFKYDYGVVKHNFDIELNIFADTMIMSWLLDSSSSNSLDSLAKRFLNFDTISYKDVVKKGENFSSVDIKEACKYASEDAFITFMLYKKFNNLLDKKLLQIAFDLEFPFIKTLYNMENRGIKLDVDFFQRLQKDVNDSLKELTEEIFKLADTEFNINSTKQLSAILFEKLKLKPIKKTKTGFSTDEQTLLQMKDEHEIISKILQYRELFKLKSTYIDPLIILAKKDKENRIFTTFLQTGTSTGRLSSKDPNLQNIPVRTDIAKEIRRGFVASKGKKLVGIDYSQIELRLLAHFSKDSVLVESFNNNEDIHLQTAKKLFENAKENRHIAKTINFGLIYGMGAKKLSQTLDISQSEAKKYIKSYFESFPTVKEFIEQEEIKVKERGYVTTLIGRKRYFDFSNATKMQEASYLREAINTIFQGSAADLIKMAMNEIENRYKDSSSVKMLLQIHDELIFEIDKESVKEHSNELKNIMENIYTLDVPLVAQVEIGDNWKELKA